jgi:hypothetical protein
MLRALLCSSPRVHEPLSSNYYEAVANSGLFWPPWSDAYSQTRSWLAVRIAAGPCALAQLCQYAETTKSNRLSDRRHKDPAR